MKQIASIVVVAVLLAGCQETAHRTEDIQKVFGKEYNLNGRTLVTAGRNRYFILEPGYQLELTGEDARVMVTVLDETEEVAGVTTRVVEEREWENGELAEVSRNFYAIDSQTRDVFYFGEDVDIYKDGEVVRHEGAWRAGVNGARVGLMMPGTPRIGVKYYQEIVPDVTMERAEIVDVKAILKTPAGKFNDCLRVEESAPLESDEREYKTYAPGIGLIQDEDLQLTHYGWAEK